MSEEKELSKSEKLEKKLEEEKKKWNQTVSELVAMLRHIDNVSEAQVLMLSYRHQLVDKLIEMKNIIGRQKSSMWNARKDRYRYYKTSYDLKLNQGEINDFIDSDIRETLLTITMLENHLTYLQMTIDTLDKTGFAISNKVTLATRF